MSISSNQTTSEAHAFAAPSAAAIWSECALYPTMARDFPEEEESEPARRGTAAHWVGVELHEFRPVAVGTVAPNGVVCDLDIIETGEHFASALHGHEWRIEKRITNKAIHEWANWGTPDAWRFGGSVLEIVDFKGGHGFVEVWRNMQLINYFALIWHEHLQSVDDTQVTVRFRIVQPNAYHPEGPVRTWEVLASDLRGYVNKLHGAAEATTIPEPRAKPGPHCKYCPGRHACEALERAGMSIVQGTYAGNRVDVPLAAQARELAYALDARDTLNALISGRETVLQMALHQGQRVPGFALVRGEGREKWTAPPERVIAMGQMMGVNLSKPDAITPRQAREKGMPVDMVAAVSERPPGALKLTRVSSERLAETFGKN